MATCGLHQWPALFEDRFSRGSPTVVPTVFFYPLFFPPKSLFEPFLYTSQGFFRGGSNPQGRHTLRAGVPKKYLLVRDPRAPFNRLPPECRAASPLFVLESLPSAASPAPLREGWNQTTEAVGGGESGEIQNYLTIFLHVLRIPTYFSRF